MKQNNYIVNDMYSEKVKQPLYDFQKFHFQNPKQQNPLIRSKDKQTTIKTVSKFYNQQDFLQQRKAKQHLLLQIMQPSKTTSQQFIVKKEQPKFKFDPKSRNEQNTYQTIKINSSPQIYDTVSDKSSLTFIFIYLELNIKNNLL